MAARNQFSEFEELSWLRRRVAELERQASERNRSLAIASEGRELLESLLNRVPCIAWVEDELGRRIAENQQFRAFESECGAAAASALRLAGSSEKAMACIVAGREFRVERFGIRTESGKRYTGGIAEAVNPPRRVSASDEVFQSELAGILECEGDRIVDASDSFLNWLGYTRQTLADPGLDWRGLTPRRFRARDDQALAQLASQGSFSAYEKEFVSRQGIAVPVLISARTIRHSSAEGEPPAFLAFVLNIGERRQLEGRLLRAQKLESLGLIAGGVAHDFNNLLATIMGNASMSLEALNREHPAYRPVNEVLVASRRASDLTQQMLAYCGRASVHVEAMDLSSMVREIGSLLRTTISKKIRLKFEMASDLPSINADPGQVQQVVMNLVINASDAIGEQPGEITVSTMVVDAPELGRSVCFQVRDTGCGMTDEVKARVFDPFFSTKAEGRGLGLSAVLGIVRNHGGALLVESEPGAGTTFRVMFPACEAAAVRRVPGTVRRELGGTETILVADDDESIRRMTKAALERFGYRVLLASNGEEAVACFKKYRTEIAAVLLDWAMPVMNGDEALTRILEEDPAAQIVMSSGYAETETMGRSGGTPLAAFIQKPYTTTQLAEKLREAIARRVGPKREVAV
jgi:PAS domain S-box-containing protein